MSIGKILAGLQGSRGEQKPKMGLLEALAAPQRQQGLFDPEAEYDVAGFRSALFGASDKQKADYAQDIDWFNRELERYKQLPFRDRPNGGDVVGYLTKQLIKNGHPDPGAVRDASRSVRKDDKAARKKAAAKAYVDSLDLGGGGGYDGGPPDDMYPEQEDYGYRGRY